MFEGLCAFADPPKADRGGGDRAARRRGRQAQDPVRRRSRRRQAACRPRRAERRDGSVRAPISPRSATTRWRCRSSRVDAYGRLAPDQKSRIVKALQAKGAVVGFLGDGINDAPALKAADIGLSVDGATGVAQAAADMILLASDLEVVADGVEEGRRTFANILKYVRMGASSNFGNMLSMAVASLFLPFLPMLPTQILLNNLLYDLSEIGIPFDGGAPGSDGAAAGLGHAAA